MPHKRGKIPQKTKERVYEHLRTEPTTTIEHLMEEFGLTKEATSGLYGYAKQRGWLKPVPPTTPPTVPPTVPHGETPPSMETPPPPNPKVPPSSETPPNAHTPNTQPPSVSPVSRPIATTKAMGNPDSAKETQFNRGFTERPALTTEPRERSVADAAMEAFRLLDSGSRMVDVMVELDLPYDRALTILQNFNALKEEENRREALDTRYLLAWHSIAKEIGEAIRDGCEHYRDESGTCGMWNPRDVDSDFRKRFPGIFTTVGRSTVRLRVLDHPEICALCHGGA